MSEAPHSRGVAQREVAALAQIYAHAIRRYEEKKAAEANGGKNDAKSLTRRREVGMN